jgi:nitroimidazol reductase NimA-like FMN-containing flavoprotein (pyridoxamine 5'-phosphate oxidase superfamily)
MFGEERTLETLSEHESVALLSTIPVGRVVFTVGALPAIVPVAFAIQDGAVVMRTSAESRLAKAAPGGVLAFEIDDIDAETRTGWSVVVMGVATVVADPAQRAAIDGVVETFAPGQRDICIRLPLTVVTGRRVTAGKDQSPVQTRPLPQPTPLAPAITSKS